MPLRIASYNNFPTAAGLASSASGLAALVASISTLFALPQSPSQLSLIARQGSGSACRSLFGGFVAWRQGIQQNGSDSMAEEVAPASHWPEMQALICVVSDQKKATSSTAGMQSTVQTSHLFHQRLAVVPHRMATIEKAIQARNFETFARVTMQDSNTFHACCLDTQPPIFYLNDVSRSIIQLIEELNKANGKPMAAYTFDAGPNAVIYTLEKDMPSIIKAITRFFPPATEMDDRLAVMSKVEQAGFPMMFDESKVVKWDKGAVKGLIHTKVGDGPRVLGVEEGLLNARGEPKVLA